ncbi:MAG: IclR family transcriptional regulator [Anaerolineaceae bacterium]|nr:IclR family transcriptional regulator [Anaerolineaceae bacterium]
MSKKSYEQQHNQSLAKALEILNMFSDQKPEWGIRELGRELGINPTTIFRLVRTMVDAGYMEQDPEKQYYSLGPRVLKLAEVYQRYNPLPLIAKKVFENYADRFEHSIYFGCLNNYELIYLAFQNGRAPLRVMIEPGASTSLHSTALGKVLLAFQKDEFIAEFLKARPLKKSSPRTIVDPQELWEQIREIRRNNYAINDGEQYPDIGSLGVPVPEKDRLNRFAISLAYPRHLITEKRITLKELLPLAQEIAREIAARINWTRVENPGLKYADIGLNRFISSDFDIQNESNHE